MKRTATVYVWLIVLVLAVFWACGVVTGYTLGRAQADGCSGYNGPVLNVVNCDGQTCTGFQIFGFWTYNCTPIAPPPAPPPAAPAPVN
jgi:hypothetical protein